jgi:hypothetical protein
MKHGTLTLLAVGLALGAPRPADALPPRPAYLTAKLGGYFPLHPDVQSYSTSSSGELALGYRPDPGFAFEAATGRFDVVRKIGGVEARKLRVIPATFAIRGTVPVKNFEPYAILGGGAYFIDDKAGSQRDHAVNLGLFLGAGGNVNLGSLLFLGLEGRYLFLGTNTFASHTRLDGFILTGDVGFRF